MSVSTGEPISIHTHSHLKDEASTNAIESEPPGDRTTEELLAHAKSLIKRAQCASKSLSTSDELKTRSNTLVSGPSQTAKGNSVQPSTSRRFHVDFIKCQMCEYTCTSITALSDHHQNDHGILKCDVCGKAFSSKPSIESTCMYIRYIKPLCVRNAVKGSPSRAVCCSTKLFTAQSLDLCAIKEHATRVSKTRAI